MADGIVRGYEEAGVKPPILLYTGHDCCGNSCIHSLFASWPVLLVRLDAWHFMRRIATGFTTDSHPLYGTFMAKLSRCIFEWSQEDVNQMVTAKRAELSMEGLPNLSDKEVFKRINKKELALHCRRRTRGAERTAALISDLIEAFSGEHGADTMGIPLLDTDRMKEIWESQQRHPHPRTPGYSTLHPDRDPYKRWCHPPSVQMCSWLVAHPLSHSTYISTASYRVGLPMKYQGNIGNKVFNIGFLFLFLFL